jgi:hypothetical protein
MVGNGATWTIVDFKNRLEGRTDVRYLYFSRFGVARRAKDTLLVLGVRDFRVVGNGAHLGWTSIACGSESRGWLNLVIEDGLELERVLRHSNANQYRSDSTIEEIMTGRPPLDPDAETYNELFARVATSELSDPLPDLIGKLESVTMLWEMIFEEFRLGEGDCPTKLSMLMYEDEGHTFMLATRLSSLLSNLHAETTKCETDDFRLASCLKRLRNMTMWVSLYSDIDKRCNEIIAAHVRLRPMLRTFYGKTLTD